MTNPETEGRFFDRVRRGDRLGGYQSSLKESWLGRKLVEHPVAVSSLVFLVGVMAYQSVRMYSASVHRADIVGTSEEAGLTPGEFTSSYWLATALETFAVMALALPLVGLMSSSWLNKFLPFDITFSSNTKGKGAASWMWTYLFVGLVMVGIAVFANIKMRQHFNAMPDVEPASSGTYPSKEKLVFTPYVKATNITNWIGIGLFGAGVILTVAFLTWKGWGASPR